MDPRPPDAFAHMSPEQKLRAAMRLYWSARVLKAAALREQHRDWSEERIQAAVRQFFLLHHG